MPLVFDEEPEVGSKLVFDDEPDVVVDTSQVPRSLKPPETLLGVRPRPARIPKVGPGQPVPDDVAATRLLNRITAPESPSLSDNIDRELQNVQNAEIRALPWTERRSRDLERGVNTLKGSAMAALETASRLGPTFFKESAGWKPGKETRILSPEMEQALRDEAKGYTRANETIPTAVPSVRDIRLPGDLLEKAQSAIFQSAPSSLPMLATAGAGAVVGGGLRAAQVGAAIGNIGLETGITRGQQISEGVDNPGRALAGGVAAGLVGTVADRLALKGLVKGGSKSIPRATLEGAGAGAISEPLEGTFEDIGTSNEAMRERFSKAGALRALDEFAEGGMAGGAITGGATAVGRLRGGPSPTTGRHYERGTEPIKGTPPDTRQLLESASTESGVSVRDATATEISRRFKSPGSNERMATIDTAGGVVLNRPLFDKWISSYPEAKRPKLVKSLIKHEWLHTFVDDKQAADFLKNSTELEQALSDRVYFGKGWRESRKTMSDALRGWEMIRFAQSYLADIDPQETVQAKGMEWLTVKTALSLLNISQKARRGIGPLGTAAAKRQGAILDKVDGNLRAFLKSRGATAPGDEAAEEASGELAGENPFSIEPPAADKMRWGHKGTLTPEAPIGPVVHEAYLEHRKPAPEKFKDALDSLGVSYGGVTELPNGKKLHSAELVDSIAGINWWDTVTPEELASKVNAKRAEFATAAQAKATPETPFAISRKKPVPQEQDELFLPPAQAGEARPSAVDLGATPVKPRKVALPTEDDIAWTAPLERGGGRPKLDFGNVEQEMSDLLFKNKKRITPEREDYAMNALDDLREAQSAGDEFEANEALSRLQRFQDSYAATAKEPAVREIAAADRNSAELSRILTSGAAVMGEPQTVSRRVTVVLDTRTGKHHVVSTFNPERGSDKVRMVDPAAMPGTSLKRPTVDFDEMPARYRPVASVLLAEPRQFYHEILPDAAAYETFMAPLRERAAQFRESATEMPAVLGKPSGFKYPYEAISDEQATAIYRAFKGAFNEAEIESRMAAIMDRPPEQTRELRSALLRVAQDYLDRNANMAPEGAIGWLQNWIYENKNLTERQFVGRATGLSEEVRRVARPGEAPAAEPEPEAPATPEPPPLPRSGVGVIKLTPPPVKPLELPSFKLEGGESGTPFAIVPPKVAEKASYVGEAMRSPVTAAHRWFSQWMSSVVREHGGKRSALAADIADEITDRAKALYGDNSEALDAAKEMAGGTQKRSVGPVPRSAVPNPALMLRNAWFGGRKGVPGMEGKFATGNVSGAFDGWIPVPSNVRPTFDSASKANLAAGQMLEPVSPGFEASNKFQRNYAPTGYDLFREGALSTKPEDNWNGYTLATATLNLDFINAQRLAASRARRQAAISAGTARGRWRPPKSLTPEQAANQIVRPMYRRLRDALSDPEPDQNRIESVNQDIARLFPKAVTHVKTLGGWQEVIHTGLFNYLENTMQRAAHTRAFREQFPNTPDGRKAFAELDRDIRRELPSNILPYWDALLKTLQGRPSDSYSNLGPFAPGRPAGEVVRTVTNTLLPLMKAARLTAQMVTQTPETFLANAELGVLNKLRALKSLPELWSEVERAGQVNAMMYDWSLDPSSPARTAARLARNVVSKGAAINFLNEFQGRLNATEARVVADRIRRGARTLSAFEKRQLPELFAKMDFTPAQVDLLMQGDEGALRMFERRYPAWKSGENAAMAEGSLAGTKRVLKDLVWFQQYPMIKLNQFRQNYLRLVDAVKSKDGQRIFNAGEGMARFLFWNMAQGAALTALASAMFGGKEGFEIKMNEAKDEPFEFLSESLLAAIGGPYYLIMQGAKHGGAAGVGEQALRAVAPYQIVRELSDMFNARGQYRDQSIGDRLDRYFLTQTPGARLAKSGLATFGLGQDNPALEQSIKGFYRWKRDAFPGDKGEAPETPEERAQFKIHMRKAAEAIQRGDGETRRKELRAAFRSVPHGTDQDAAIRGSLLGRRILFAPDNKPLDRKQLEALRNRIGDDAVRRLKAYDLKLEAIADGF